MNFLKQFITGRQNEQSVRIKGEDDTQYKLNPKEVAEYIRIRQGVCEEACKKLEKFVKPEYLARNLVVAMGKEQYYIELPDTGQVSLNTWLREEIQRRFVQEVPDYHFAPLFHQTTKLKAQWEWVDEFTYIFVTRMNRCPGMGLSIGTELVVVAEIPELRHEGPRLNHDGDLHRMRTGGDEFSSPASMSRNSTNDDKISDDTVPEGSGVVNSSKGTMIHDNGSTFTAGDNTGSLNCSEAFSSVTNPSVNMNA